MPRNIRTLEALTDRTGVFEDRRDAGLKLARLLEGQVNGDAAVVAIPAGGVDVAAALAGELGLNLQVSVVSKITLPWNTESGCGAVAFDGTVRINEPMVQALPLGSDALDQRLQATRRKVRRRIEKFGQIAELTYLKGRHAILVDDGLASGFTMLAAIDAVRNLAPSRLDVAVPTAHQRAAEDVAAEVHTLYCANLRHGRAFAVAAAYRYWSDVDESDAIAEAKRFAGQS
jgi:predicted phosphoribosyltransferase